MGDTGHSADSWKYGKDIGAPPSFQKIMEVEKSSGIAITSQSSGFTGNPGRGSGHVANSYHYWGNAVDSSSSAGNMAALAKWIYDRYWAQTLELIHSGGGGFFVHNGVKVAGSYYGATLVSQHYNHVHWAITMSGLAAGGAGTSSSGTITQDQADQASKYNTVTTAAKTSIKSGCGATAGAGLLLVASVPVNVLEYVHLFTR